MHDATRRRFLRASLVGGLVGYGSIAHGDYLSKLNPTPSEFKGPFYPVTPQKDKDFDLTQVEGQTGVAKGEVIWVEGKVLDTDGKAIEDASVDIWQANAAGRYAHPHESNSAPLDPNFQGWAIIPSGKQGDFKFKTIMPGAYPGSDDWVRPPHIHFKVSKLSYVELVTQMYFPGNPLNEKDLLFNRKGPEERKLLIASKITETPAVYRFQIVLQKA